MQCNNKTKQMRGELDQRGLKKTKKQQRADAKKKKRHGVACGGGGEAGDESDGCPSVKYVQIPPSSRSLLARQRE